MNELADMGGCENEACSGYAGTVADLCVLTRGPQKLVERDATRGDNL